MITHANINASSAGQGTRPAVSGATADGSPGTGRPSLAEDAERTRVRRDLTQALHLEAESANEEERKVEQTASVPSPDPESLDAEQLVLTILSLPESTLICHAGSYLRAAAKQPDTLALETLCDRKAASGIFRHGTIGGWQLKDSPYKAAIDRCHYENVRLLLQLRAIPDAPLLAALPAMAPEVRQAFNDYDYTICSTLVTPEKINRPALPSTRPSPPRRTTGVDALTYRGGDRVLTRDALENIILFRPDSELLASESGLIRAAAECENAEALIKSLCRRGIALHPRAPVSERGWKPEDCPFLAATRGRHYVNLRTLLELGARPALNSQFRQQLPTMEPAIRDLFRALADIG